MNPAKRNIGAAIALIFVAPLVAEYLLGDLPLTLLPALLMLAPFYGGGALTIRELARRNGRGWPTMLLLGAAYTLLEEGFATQSLFNRNYLGMNLHLLDHAWMPAFGISAWWTLFMFNLHTFWSIGVSIALVEGLTPASAQKPWLGKVGDSIVFLLFGIGFAGNAAYSVKHDHFVASGGQFATTAVFIVLLVCMAFLIRFQTEPSSSGSTMSAGFTGGATFVLGMGVLKTPPGWGWGAVATIAMIDAVFLAVVGVLSRRQAWTALHTLSVGGGGAIAYGVNAFFQPPVVGGKNAAVVLASHIIMLCAALAVVAIGARRTVAWVRSEAEALSAILLSRIDAGGEASEHPL